MLNKFNTCRLVFVFIGVLMSGSVSHASDQDDCQKALDYITKLGAIHSYAQGSDLEKRITDLNIEYAEVRKQLYDSNRRLWELMNSYWTQMDICKISGHLSGYEPCRKAAQAKKEVEKICKSKR